MSRDEHRRTQGFAPQVRIGVHASDATQVGRQFKGKGVHEAARISALAEGGQVFMPIQETFFATRFAQVRDRFGINWMVNYTDPARHR